MRRRRFLQLLGLITAGAALQLSFGAVGAFGASRVVSFGGVLYRGDRRGDVFLSRDSGITWELHSSLGPRYSVKRLAVDPRGRLRATVGFGRRSFGLVLGTDQKRWLTS